MWEAQTSAWGIGMVFRRTWLLMLAAVVAAVACSVVGGAPTISSGGITPATPTPGQIQLQIKGTNFYPKIVPDAGNPSQSTISPVQVALLPPSAGATPILLTLLTTGNSPTLLLTSSYRLFAAPYTLRVTAAGGTITHSFTVNPAPTPVGQVSRIVFSSGAAALATSDVVNLTLTLEDGSGNPVPASTSLSAALVLSSSNAKATPAGASIAVGQSSFAFAVTDTKAEQVTVRVSTAGLSVTLIPGLATFNRGPPVSARVVGAVGDLNSASTFFVIQDLYGNPTTVAAPFQSALSAIFSSGGTCTDESLSSPITVAAQNSEAAFTMQCDEVTPGIYSVKGGNNSLIESSGLLNFQ